MININLLPSAQRRQVVVFDAGLRGLLTALIIVILLVVIGHIWQTVLINRYNDQVATWNDKIAQVEQQVKEVDDLRDQVDQLKAKAELLERIKQSPLQMAELLADLSHVTPTGVWLTNVQVSHEVGSAVIQGKTSTLREVADLMLNLDGSSIFGDATLNSASQPGGTNPAPGSVTFNVTGHLNPAVSGQ